jgi:hypothetical protein
MTEDADKLLDDLVAFCQERGNGHCFSGWAPETIRGYLLWFVRRDGLRWLKDGQGRIVGLGTAIPMKVEDMSQTFAWKHDPDAGTVYIADVIANGRGVLSCLIKSLVIRYNPARYTYFAHRGDRLVNVTKRYLQIGLNHGY